MGNRQFIIRVLVLAGSEKAGTAELIVAFSGLWPTASGPRQWSWPGPALIRRLFGRRTSAVSWLLWLTCLGQHIFTAVFNPNSRRQTGQNWRNLKSVDGFTDCILAQRVTTRRDPTPPPGGPADHSLDFAKTKDYTKFVFIISLLKLSPNTRKARPLGVCHDFLLTWVCPHGPKSIQCCRGSVIARAWGPRCCCRVGWIGLTPRRRDWLGGRRPGDRVKDVFIILIEFSIHSEEEEKKITVMQRFYHWLPRTHSRPFFAVSWLWLRRF